ncbi:MAG: ABC transporter ATP-binding protein [Syntrophomonadaceae bacterium]|nr:ABC transporter ATP-binding protein [Syntrophomonadaceae bacterium]MDD3889540.1 ABC transporter ATP-binding protein [Syntrophomonadaceae bacterium]MDD4548537.1 ABC transporter ATP-binding protein [Syntrophomonadaceae bacterium]
MAGQELIRLEKVSKTYLMGEVTVAALQETSVTIYQGELLVILGPSGSGKSTMLNLIGGMDKPTAGKIIYRDRDLSQAHDRELTSYRRQDVGFVFQFYNLIPDLTATENVALAADLVENPLPVAQVMEDVGLGDRKEHFPAQLSGGEQQRVAIARAIVKRPELLLCDEPTGALDYQTGKIVLNFLYQIRRQGESTVIIVTHNTAIARMADRVFRMRSGQISEVVANPNPLSPERIDW